MPVRIRITLLFTLLVAIILTLVCASVYYFSYSLRVSTIKAKLTNRAITIGRLLNNPDIFSNPLIERIDSATSLAYRDKVIQVYDYKSNIVYKYSDNPKDSITISSKLLNEARARGNIFFNIGKKDAVIYHYISNNYRLFIVTAGEDREGKQNLRYLIKVLILSYFAGLVIACAGGYFFSKVLLKPIKKIADEANHISVQNLSARIDTGRAKDEWHYLSDTLNALLNRLQNSFDLQKRFIANASHELSTPLTSISNQIEVSLQRKRNAEEYRKVMESVYQDVLHLSNLTKTLLTVAKASGMPEGIEISMVRTDELLLRLPSEMSKSNKVYSVSFDFNDLPEDDDRLTVLGNEELLFTAIKNLVTNACKYSDNNQAIIKLSIRNEEVVIGISDTGVGIPFSELERIFQPFHRVSDTHNKEGFGLGLSLASGIIKLHKGEVDVSSAINKGSTFTVRLPCAKKKF